MNGKTVKLLRKIEQCDKAGKRMWHRLTQAQRALIRRFAKDKDPAK